jgi:hypothetical protein
MSLWGSVRAPARSRTASHSLHGRPVARSTAAGAHAREAELVHARGLAARPGLAHPRAGERLPHAGFFAAGARTPGLRAAGT